MPPLAAFLNARQRAIQRQSACKPGSVWPGRARPRRPFLWDARLRAPHATNPSDRASGQASRRRKGGADVAPIRFCSRRGLPCRRRCRRRGALLPHPFTLAVAPALTAKPTAVCFLWRYPWGRPRRTLSGAASAWSPDFPPPRRKGGGRPADWRIGGIGGPAGKGQGKKQVGPAFVARFWTARKPKTGRDG